jgi:hypothetical protein
MTIINGKTYPMWNSIVDARHELIGGTLTEIDNITGSASTKIIDIRLLPNGTDSAMIEIEGEEFTASCDVRYCGIAGGNGLTIRTNFGTEWNLKKATKQ